MIGEKTVLARLLEVKGHYVHTVDRECSVFDCVAKMNELQVGAFLIVEDGQLVGIVSERDIIRNVFNGNSEMSAFTVEDIMTTDLTTVGPDTSVSQAMNIVTTSRIRHLPVVSARDGIVGLISIGDLVNWVINEQQKHIEELTNYISGEH